MAFGKKVDKACVQAVLELKDADYSKEPEVAELYRRLTQGKGQFVQLMNKNLVEAVGRSEAVGRPVLYGTTDTFLKNFGFTSIKDLPEIDDIESAINVDAEADSDGLSGKDGGCEGQMSIEL